MSVKQTSKTSQVTFLKNPIQKLYLLHLEFKETAQFERIYINKLTSSQEKNINIQY